MAFHNSTLTEQSFILQLNSSKLIVMRKILFSVLFVLMAAYGFAATYTVNVSGLTFVPDSISITTADTVVFIIPSPHDAVEVDYATWVAGGTTPLTGGFSLTPPGGIVTGLTVGNHYYVCTPHAALGMKGVINVSPAPGPGIFELTGVGVPAIKDFTGYQSTGFTPHPVAGQLNSNNWATTGFEVPLAFGDSNVTGDHARGVTAGGVSSGGIYALSGLDMIWIQPAGSDFTPGTLTLRVLNNSGTTLNTFDLSYLIYVFNDQGRGNSFNLAYSTDDVSYTNVTALDYTSADVATGTFDSIVKSTTIAFANVPNGSYLYLRWYGDDVSGSGSRDEFGLDNISVSGTYVTPPVNPIFTFTSVDTSIEESVTVFNATVEITNMPTDTSTIDVVVLGSSTATSGTDYTFPTTTLTFPPGTNSQTFEIYIINDMIQEPTEVINFALANPSDSGSIVDSFFNLTILDDDALTISFDTNSMDVPESAGTINVMLSMNLTSANPTNVDVVVKSTSTAVDGTDYSYVATTVTFAAGASGPELVNINILDDGMPEYGKTLVLELMNQDNGAILGDSIITINIIDDDPIATGTCANLFISEYVEGSANNKAIEIYNPTSSAVNLADYSIVLSGNGGSFTNYFYPTGTLAANDVYVMVHASADSVLKTYADTLLSGFSVVNFNGDDAVILRNFNDTLDIIGEPGVDPGTNWPVGSGATSEFTLVRKNFVYEGSLDWSVGATQWEVFPQNTFDSLGVHHTLPCGAIVPATVQFASTSATVTEGSNALVTFMVDNPMALAVSVDVAIDVASTASTADHNYVASTYTDPENDSITIITFDDLDVEPSETLILTLSSTDTNVVIGTNNQFILTINDNDDLVVSFAGTLATVPEAVGTYSIAVKLNNVSANPTNVDVSYLSGDAIQGTDFTFTDMTVTIPAMDTMVEFDVVIINDTIDEANEMAVFELSNPTNGAVLGAPLEFTLVIADDDTTIIGLNDVNFAKATNVFPNPAVNVVVVESSVALSTIQLFDMNGAVVMQLNCGNEPVKRNMDVSALAKGVYQIRLSNEQGDYVVRKLVIQ